MMNPLFISRNAFFANSPGGECMRAFLSGMTPDEWSPTIYASARTPLVDGIPEYAHLTTDYAYMQYMAAFIRRLLPDLTFLPGYEWQSWGINAAKVIIRDIKDGVVHPDYIHSVSFPCACHKVALKVKRETGLPWVMQLYDPYADNPYRPFKTKFFKDIDWKQERECVENADLIIHSNQSIADVWKERYGAKNAQKIVSLPFTVPLPNTEVEPVTHKSGEMLTISHIGNFMLNRTSQPFIQAVAVLTNKHPEYKQRLNVNYIGRVTESEKELIQQKGLTGLFNLTGSISAEACIEYYKKSDLFLAIDGVNKDNLFFPSKILKYLYYRRPILGITPNGSVLDRELRQAGHTSIANENIEGIVKYLERALCDYESLCCFNIGYWHRFEPKNVVAVYETMVREVLNNR